MSAFPSRAWERGEDEDCGQGVWEGRVLHINNKQLDKDTAIKDDPFHNEQG